MPQIWGVISSGHKGLYVVVMLCFFQLGGALGHVTVILQHLPNVESGDFGQGAATCLMSSSFSYNLTLFTTDCVIPVNSPPYPPRPSPPL
jgi:hypothetical protein